MAKNQFYLKMSEVEIESINLWVIKSAAEFDGAQAKMRHSRGFLK